MLFVLEYKFQKIFKAICFWGFGASVGTGWEGLCILYENRRVQIWSNMQIPSSTSNVVYTRLSPDVSWIIRELFSNSSPNVSQPLGLVNPEAPLFVLSWSLGFHANSYSFSPGHYTVMESLFCKSKLSLSLQTLASVFWVFPKIVCFNLFKRTKWNMTPKREFVECLVQRRTHWGL